MRAARTRTREIERLAGAAVVGKIKQSTAIATPFALNHDGQTVDDNIEKAADQQAEHRHRTDHEGGLCGE